MIKYIFLILLTGSLGCRQNQNPRLTLITEPGEIELELLTDRAPITANNFMELVRAGSLKEAIFYRVVRLDNQPNSAVLIEVIQGGLFEDSLIAQHMAIPHETTAETGILHKDGILSMARNEPGSASTEFFICIGDQPSLDFGGQRNPDGQGFAAFGKVTRGMEVVRKIQSLPDTGQYLNERIRVNEIILH